MMRASLVALLLIGGCAEVTGVETTAASGVDGQPSTVSSASSATPVVKAPTSTAAEELSPVTFDPFTAGGEWNCGDVSQNLGSQKRYEMSVGPVMVELQPPSDHWDLCSYQIAGEQGGALLEWGGPAGFKAETLNVRVFDVGDDLDAAWARIDEFGREGATKHGLEWTQVQSGTNVVGGLEVEWREFRTPKLPRIVSPGLEEFYIVDEFITDVWGDTSVRFFVVPVEEFTVTVMVYETRCACTGSPNRLDDGDQIADDVENELSMWIAELDAFLASMSFEAP